MTAVACDCGFREENRSVPVPAQVSTNGVCTTYTACAAGAQVMECRTCPHTRGSVSAMHMKNQRISTVILFTTLIMTSGITACSRSEDSPSGSSAGGAAGRSSTGPGGAGAGANDAANASGGGGGSAGKGGASPDATSDARAGGQSFDGSAGATAGSSR